MRTSTKKILNAFNPFYRFTTLSQTELPVIDLGKFLSEKSASEIKNATDSLYKYGVMVVKDPRVPSNYNEEFLNLFERYYASRAEMRKNNQNVPECFPENGYQTGKKEKKLK
jgi:hypothetical protein